MSEITERDAIKRERAAYVEGASDVVKESHHAVPDGEYLMSKAVERYPLPKTFRPRVVTVNGTRYRVWAGAVECQSACISPPLPWKAIEDMPRYSELRVIADLIVAPLERVEDDS